MLTSIALYYLAAINAISFILYGIDKYKAKKKFWRIKESTLILWAFIGGSIGAYTAMRFFHHKTRHKKFKYGIPAIIIFQIILIWLYMRTTGYSITIQ